MATYKRCIVILADGARSDVMADQLARGRLPNLSRYVVEKGHSKTILTAFPSTTGPAYLPYLTGCFPGTCNVPGIRWFDRAHYAKHGWSYKSFRSYVGLETFLLNRDINPSVQTAFELFPHSHSIMNMVHRGLKKKGNATKWGRIWYLYYGHLTDHWGFVDEISGLKLLKAIDDDFEFIFTVFPAIDEYAHRSSPLGQKAQDAYVKLDKILGQTFHRLKMRGKLDDTLIILVSDHGLSDTGEHFDVGPYLEEKGIKTFFYTQIFKRNFKAASMVSGNGMAHLYFKNKNGWEHPSTFEELCESGLILDELRHRKEVALVASKGLDGSIHIQTDKGHGFFSTTNQGIRYKWDREEPLGLSCEGLEGKEMNLTWKQSLEKTFDTHTPDVFMQLKQIFTSPRTGDVIISAKSGYDLRKKYEVPLHRASHGALCPEHMKIPLLINANLGPDFQSKHVRSVDLYPTMLQLMGKPVPENIDGYSLV